MADTSRQNAIENAKQQDSAAMDKRDINRRRVNRDYNKTSNALKYGVIAGVIVGIYQVLLDIEQQGINIGLGLLGFALMTPVVWYALRDLKSHLAAGEFYKNAAIFSVYISVAAAVVTAIISVIGYSILASTGIAETEISIVKLLPNVVFQLFVGVVIGNLIAFIFMQGMKSDVPEDEFIENQKDNA